jgi:proline dehydrogenase
VLAASRSPRVERLVTRAPLSRGLVRRFVGGSDTSAAVAAARGLVADGLTVSLDHLGEDTTDAAQATEAAGAYTTLLRALADAGLTERANPLCTRVDVSVKLSAIGRALPDEGPRLALEHARTICQAAKDAEATVTLDMEDHTTTDATLGALRELRTDFPDVGAVVQAYLRRTEGDCRDLATAGSRVRLCKGAYREPASVAFARRREVHQSYLRCMRILIEGAGYPMLATHDPELIMTGMQLASARGKGKDGYELQMLYGIRPEEQRRLADSGTTVRVYVPYGAQWYGYLMRRLAERPANLAFFGRALLSRG